jgi:anti-sigma factor ChrR (cupin superfamily)
MNIHADPMLRVVLATTDLPWTPSPLVGLERRLLDRQGDEVGRTPSIVRYAPGSQHRPWSDAGCSIWVKTGHLPATRGADGSEG